MSKAKRDFFDKNTKRKHADLKARRYNGKNTGAVFARDDEHRRSERDPSAAFRARENRGRSQNRCETPLPSFVSGRGRMHRSLR